jgi:hypothetical protein
MSRRKPAVHLKTASRVPVVPVLLASRKPKLLPLSRRKPSLLSSVCSVAKRLKNLLSPLKENNHVAASA